MLNLEVVETAPRIVSSTHGGRERGYMIYIMYFLAHFHGWTLEGESFYCITHCISAFWQRKKDQGFAVLFGIPVVTCIDGVFLFVLVSLLCESSSYFFFCKLGK